MSTSFNNGLYTPFDEATALSALPLAPTSTYVAPPVIPVTTSTPVPTTTPSTIIAPAPVSSAATTAAPVATPPPTTYSTTPLYSPPALTIPAVSSHGISSVAISSTVSASSIVAVPTASGTVEASTQDTVKPLTPLFVIIPLVLLAVALGLTYPRYWSAAARQRRRKSWGGSTLGHEDFDEHGGLVQGKWVGDDGNEDEKMGRWEAHQAARTKRGKGGFLGGISSFLHRNLSSTSRLSTTSTQFRAVPYASLETPFMKPSASTAEILRKAYLTPSVEDHDQRQTERGWAWGTHKPEPEPARAVEQVGRGAGLTEGWRWASRKYRPRMDGSKSSLESGSSFGTLQSVLRGAGLRRKVDESGKFLPLRHQEQQQQDAYTSLPSPSIYSPTPEDDAQKHGEYLDSILGGARVGNDALARRYLAGEMTEKDMLPFNNSNASRQAIRQTVEPIQRPHQGFRMDAGAVPQAPSLLHLSPKKTTIRSQPPNALNSTPTKAGLFFSYDSPPPSATRYTDRSPTRAPTSASRSPRKVGVEMPAYERGIVRASESTLSLSGGLAGLVFGEEIDEKIENERRGSARMREMKMDEEEDGYGGVEEVAIRIPQPQFVASLTVPRSPSSKAIVTRTPAPTVLPVVPRGTFVPPIRSAGIQIAPSSSTSPTLPTSPPLAPFASPSRVRQAVNKIDSVQSSPVQPRPLSTVSSRDNDEELEQAKIVKLLQKRSSKGLLHEPPSSEEGITSPLTSEASVYSQEPIIAPLRVTPRRIDPTSIRATQPRTTTRPTGSALSEDPKRLSAMLRKSQSVEQLQGTPPVTASPRRVVGSSSRTVESPSRRMGDGATGTRRAGAAGGGLEAMLRRVNDVE